MSYLWGGERTTVYVVGGTGSVSSAVFDRLAGLANVSRVRRLSASSAAGVATLVAQGGGHAWWPSTTTTHRVILVNGANVADGLLAASLAHGGWASVLYVNKTSMPSQTGALLASSDATSVYIMGGTNSISGATESWLKANLPAATVLRLRGSSSGGSIYDLSHWVADWGVANGRLNNGSVVVVPGGAVVDAAAAVGISRQTGGPILFTPKTALSSSVTGFIGDAGDLLQTSYVLGDSSLISDKTFEAFRTHYTAPLAP
jgi:putative cell wall-binding protein